MRYIESIETVSTLYSLLNQSFLRHCKKTLTSSLIQAGIWRIGEVSCQSRKYLRSLGLAALAISLSNGAAHAGFSTTEVQLHYGGNYKVGSNSTFGSGFSETTDRATITLEHFSTNDIGDLFFFVDFFWQVPLLRYPVQSYFEVLPQVSPEIS